MSRASLDSAPRPNQRNIAERLIAVVDHHLSDPLELKEVARRLHFSPYYVHRTFRRVTGLSPGRFISGLRLEQAKSLLAKSDLSVTDVSLAVGYRSLGSFVSSFARNVGVTPTMFRRAAAASSGLAHPSARIWSRPGSRDAGICGSISADQGTTVFVGLFEDPLPAGQPIACSIVEAPGRYRLSLENLDGTFYIFAVEADAFGEMRAGRPLVAGSGPIELSSTRASWHRADLALRPRELFDPPLVFEPSATLFSEAYEPRRIRGVSGGDS